MTQKRVTLIDKTFELSISEKEILQAVNSCAENISSDYAGKNPVFIVVLNGAFIFAADLIRKISFPCQTAFTKLTSYIGTTTTEKIEELLPIDESIIKGRHIIIVEDIIETGYSMSYLQKRLQEYNPDSIEICTLFHKPEKCRVPDLNIKYVGMKLPEAFIVGYGLDYNSLGRNLKDIYSLV